MVGGACTVNLRFPVYVVWQHVSLANGGQDSLSSCAHSVALQHGRGRARRTVPEALQVMGLRQSMTS